MICCGLTGAPLKFSIYTGTPSAEVQAQEKVDKKGARDKGEVAPPTRLANTIMDLIPEYCRISSPLYFPRNIVVDNYYNYPAIHRMVNALGLGMLGTFAARGRKPLVPGRETFPFSYSDAQAEKLPKGWLRQAIQDSAQGTRRLIAIVWRDNKIAKFLSSVCVRAMNSASFALRKTSESKGERVQVPAHPVSLLYNKYMGGVDLMDQYMAKFPVGFKVRRWYMRVFYWLLNLAVVTVFIYIKIRGGPAYTALSASNSGGAQFNFRLRLQDQLWNLALKDGNYKKKSDTSRLKRLRAEKAVELAKKTRKERMKVGGDAAQTPGKKYAAPMNTPGSAGKVTRAKSPPNSLLLPFYNPLVAQNSAEKEEKRGGHQWVLNDGKKQVACKVCLNALTQEQKRTFYGNKKEFGKRKIASMGVVRTTKHCSFCKCKKMPLCKKHFEEHINKK